MEGPCHKLASLETDSRVSVWEVYWVLWSWGGLAELFQMEAIIPCVDGLSVQLSPGRGYASGRGLPSPERHSCAPPAAWETHASALTGVWVLHHDRHSVASTVGYQVA